MKASVGSSLSFLGMSWGGDDGRAISCGGLGEESVEVAGSWANRKFSCVVDGEGGRAIRFRFMVFGFWFLVFDGGGHRIHVQSLTVRVGRLRWTLFVVVGWVIEGVGLYRCSIIKVMLVRIWR